VWPQSARDRSGATGIRDEREEARLDMPRAALSPVLLGLLVSALSVSACSLQGDCEAGASPSEVGADTAVESPFRPGECAEFGWTSCAGP
jgi:hypothetical protein